MANATAAEMMTPLHYAANGGSNRIEMLQLLLKYGARPDEEPSYTSLPAFHYWILYGRATGQEIRVFLDNHASISKINLQGANVLHYFACVGEKPEDLIMLLEHKGEDEEDRANINIADTVTGETPFHMLMNRRDIPLDLLEAFVARHADVNLDDQYSKRPLYQAAWEGELEAIKIIINAVTDIDDDDNHGRIALHGAAYMGHKEVVDFLIQHRSNPLRTDKHNRTALFWACLGKSEDTALFLLKKIMESGAGIGEINMVTKRGRTPLRQASANGFQQVVEMILGMTDAPKIINTVDKRKGRSALHCAAFRGRVKIVKALLEKGADYTIQDGVEGKGKTALQLCHEQWAFQGTSNFEETLSLLMDHDTAAAAKDSRLAATAAINGSKAILEKLHKAQVDLDKMDEYGWTPFLLAKQFQHSDAVEYLARQTKPTKWIIDKDTQEETYTQITTDCGRRLEHSSDTRCCVTADRPVSSGISKYYYEVEIFPSPGPYSVEKAIVGIGFCTQFAPSLLEFPGWPKPGVPSSKSWAYHGDDGGLFCHNFTYPTASSETYGPGDVIGCGVDFDTRSIWFTKNGKKIDHGFDDVMGRLFPVVGLKDPLAVEANFGNDFESKPFKWVEGMDIK